MSFEKGPFPRPEESDKEKGKKVVKPQSQRIGEEEEKMRKRKEEAFKNDMDQVVGNAKKIERILAILPENSLKKYEQYLNAEFLTALSQNLDISLSGEVSKDVINIIKGAEDYVKNITPEEAQSEGKFHEIYSNLVLLEKKLNDVAAIEATKTISFGKETVLKTNLNTIPSEYREAVLDSIDDDFGWINNLEVKEIKKDGEGSVTIQMHNEIHNIREPRWHINIEVKLKKVGDKWEIDSRNANREIFDEDKGKMF